jgi:hypothetical protein
VRRVQHAVQSKGEYAPTSNAALRFQTLRMQILQEAFLPKGPSKQNN